MSYDIHYKTENLFGEPYPELIDFFANYPTRGKVLDMGCGQGRDAIPIARLGYEVMGIDNSKVGIEQMLQVAEKEGLNLKGKVSDIHKFSKYQDFDFVLFDSMFHFQKKDKEKETGLIKSTIKTVKPGCLIIPCIQDTGNKVKILNEAIDFENKLERLTNIKFNYTWEDKETGHESTTRYRMIVARK
ncbi:class I SAM-dependent methyltransferase [Maribacter halichondriae]|uniref:class I SAM-dependent methyltransferase n=1 Tax=Maribacter halichondriae TaxID=2980554 RepID=UPI00235A0941|nr:methyltransferase domain-containing protein [Maribacter sp. Hal144]